MKLMKCYRKPITLSDLWVTTHDKLSDFYASSLQSGESPAPLLIIRLIISSIALAILLWSLCESPSPYWLLYLTNWGMLLLTVALLSGLAVSIGAVTKKPTIEEGGIPWHISFYWYMFNVSMPLSVLISALYWILLFDPNIKKEMGMRFFLLEIATHGVNSCLVMVEIIMSRTPVRFFHMYQPLSVGMWYAIFSYVYFFLGGTDINGFPFIYSILDWRLPKRSSVIVSISVVALVIIYMLIWVLAYIRDKISMSFRETSSAMAQPEA